MTKMEDDAVMKTIKHFTVLVRLHAEPHVGIGAWFVRSTSPLEREVGMNFIRAQCKATGADVPDPIHVFTFQTEAAARAFYDALPGERLSQEQHQKMLATLRENGEDVRDGRKSWMN